MRFSFGNTPGKWFVNAVNYAFKHQTGIITVSFAAGNF
jgi:hypothetical protein